jgi:hypothetical protein
MSRTENLCVGGSIPSLVTKKINNLHNYLRLRSNTSSGVFRDASPHTLLVASIKLASSAADQHDEPLAAVFDYSGRNNEDARVELRHPDFPIPA